MLECLFQPYAAPIPSHSLLGIVQQFATPTPPDNKGPGIPCALFNLKVKFGEPCTNRLDKMYFNFLFAQMGKLAFFYFRKVANDKRAAPCEGCLFDPSVYDLEEPGGQRSKQAEKPAANGAPDCPAHAGLSFEVGQAVDNLQLAS